MFFQVALECCHKALELDQNLIHAWHTLGTIQASLKQWAEAAESLGGFVKLSADENDPYVIEAKQNIIEYMRMSSS